MGRAREIKIGTMKFKIDSLEKLSVKLPDTTPFSLITGTPIIVRIPREKYKEGDFDQMKYDYVYWRTEHPIDIFISQLENNLSKKYAQYHQLTNRIANFRSKDMPEISHLFHSLKTTLELSLLFHLLER